MIYEPIEVFKIQSGLIPSLDTHDNGESQCVFLNFDDASNPENAGGYISLRLNDDFVYVEAFNSSGDIISKQAFHCSEFKPVEA